MTKRVVARDTPLSIKASRDARYYVADTYLRFWLRFIEAVMAELERGRSDIVLNRIKRGWEEWRGAQ